MVSKWANPQCEEIFRYLHHGRLFNFVFSCGARDFPDMNHSIGGYVRSAARGLRWLPLPKVWSSRS